MKLLATIRPKSAEVRRGATLKRRASRGIILDGENILLLYTKRYNDFSFPGGGVDDHEDLIVGLHRELKEETGASNIRVLEEFGYIDEIRPHYRPEYAFMHMLSYFYQCEVDQRLGRAKMEHYEIANGMEPRWINTFEALEHNRKVIASNESTMGLSIERETMVLDMVARRYLNG